MFINIYLSTVVPLGGVMISVLASIVVDHGFKPKTIKLVLLLPR